MMNASRLLPVGAFLTFALSGGAAPPYLDSAQDKPVLHGRHWVAITGKPLGAMAGARMFEKGGNAVDAACAMLGVVCTMFDDVSWGGETQALIYDPRTKKSSASTAVAWRPPARRPNSSSKSSSGIPPPRVRWPR
jgi:gamma-glutamyltranspeptidase/glutathione hydrolase